MGFVNKSSSFREVERNKMQAFELTQKCINSISELTMNKYKMLKLQYENENVLLFKHLTNEIYLDFAVLLT